MISRSPNQLWPRFRLLFDPSPRLTPRVRKVFENLIVSYTKSDREYHNTDHIAACLDFADEHPCPAMSLQRAAELAIWWHDAEYQPNKDPKSTISDETRSAFRFMEEAQSLAVDFSTITAVHAAIVATRHLRTPGPLSLLSSYVIDVDLSILAVTYAEYVEYVAKVRQEYAHVDDKNWRIGRANFLESMLKRPTIFMTDEIRILTDTGTTLEAFARDNMNRELKELA